MDTATPWAKAISDWLPSFLEGKLSIRLGTMQLTEKIQLSENMRIHVLLVKNPEIKVYLDCSRDNTTRPWLLTATENNFLQGDASQLSPNVSPSLSKGMSTVDRLDHYVFADAFITSRQETFIAKNIYVTTLIYHDRATVPYLHGTEEFGYFCILAETPSIIRHSKSLGENMSPVHFRRNTAPLKRRTWLFEKYNAQQTLRLSTSPVTFVSVNSGLALKVILATFWRRENEPYYYVFILQREENSDER